MIPIQTPHTQLRCELNSDCITVCGLNTAFFFMAHLRFGMLQNRVKKGQYVATSMLLYVFPGSILIQNVLKSVIFEILWVNCSYACIRFPINNSKNSENMN